MLLVENKKAKLNFEILEKFFAGVVLKGFEVKALKLKKGSLKGSYISIKNNEAFLVGATISPYQERNVPTNYNPQRERKLLLKKKEIIELIDSYFFKTLLEKVDMKNSIICVTCDHTTSCMKKAHTDMPVPVLIYGKDEDETLTFSESEAKKGGLGKILGKELIYKLAQFAKR